MRRELGASRLGGEIRDVLASSSRVISEICEYEMTRGRPSVFYRLSKSRFLFFDTDIDSQFRKVWHI